MGAGVLLLNMFDVTAPGHPEACPRRNLRRRRAYAPKMTGRPIGINLEPVAEGEEGETDPI